MFLATMLTNTVIKVTFGDLRAQQISAIIFQCGVISHRVRLSLIVYSSIQEKPNKMLAVSLRFRTVSVKDF